MNFGATFGKFKITSFSYFLLVAIFFGIPEQVVQRHLEPYMSHAELKSAALRFEWKDLPSRSKMDIKLATFGKKLFFDPRMSANGAVSCASCHSPGLSFTDGRKVAEGVKTGKRNTPTLINSFKSEWFFWDGRADSLAAQALGPLESSLEHNTSRGEVAELIYLHYRQEYELIFGKFPNALERLLGEFLTSPFRALPQAFCQTTTCEPLDNALATYAIATISDFQTQNGIILRAGRLAIQPQELLAQTWTKAVIDSNLESAHKRFNDLTMTEKAQLNTVFVNIGHALAAYQKGLLAVSAPFDQFVKKLASGADPQKAFTPEFFDDHWQGFKTFLTAGCSNCHNGPNFSDQQFHNIGLAWNNELDLGRAEGLKRLMTDQFRCLQPALESCKQQAFLDTKSPELIGAFKTPTLRNLSTTAPYMHDGRFSTLQEVIEHYTNSTTEPAVGHRTESIPRLRLSKAEQKHLILFLGSLNSPVIDLTQEN